MPSISIASSLAISSPQIGGPLLRLELVERRAHRIRLEPVGTAIHVLDTRAPHHAVFPRARSAARHVLPHIPRPLSSATRVGLGHHGQLVVREHRPPQAQQGAQPALKVFGRGGYVVPHPRICTGFEPSMIALSACRDGRLPASAPACSLVPMRHTTFALCWGILLGAIIAPALPAQVAGARTAEQIRASYDAHHADFDYLLGDWEFTAVN